MDNSGKSERGRIYRERRGGRERVDRGKSERGRIECGEEKGKDWIREGKVKGVG